MCHVSNSDHLLCYAANPATLALSPCLHMYARGYNIPLYYNRRVFATKPHVCTCMRMDIIYLYITIDESLLLNHNHILLITLFCLASTYHYIAIAAQSIPQLAWSYRLNTL
jgi:hypothetical protein